MIDLLVLVHSSKKILASDAINPANIKVKVIDRIEDEIPLIFFGHMLYDCILCF